MFVIVQIMIFVCRQLSCFGLAIVGKCLCSVVMVVVMEVVLAVLLCSVMFCVVFVSPTRHPASHAGAAWPEGA